MKILYSERDGRKYAYLSTSRRIPGKQYPVSKVTYLGPVDSESGHIYPRKKMSMQDCFRLNECTVYDVGSARLVFSVAKRIGLIEDLHTVFEERAPYIIAIVLAMAISPSKTELLPKILESAHILKQIGIADNIAVKDIRNIINKIGRDDIRSFYVNRLSRTNGKLYVYCREGVLDIDKDNLFKSGNELNAPNPYVTKETLAIVISEKNTLIETKLISSPFENSEELFSFLETLGSASRRCILVCDPCPIIPSTISKLLSSNVSLVLPVILQSTDVSDEKSYFENKQPIPDEYSERGLSVYGPEIMGVKIKGRFLDIVHSSDSDFSDSFHLDSYLVYDSGMASISRKSLHYCAEYVKKRLDGTMEDDPKQMLDEIAGSYAYLFSFKTKSDGTLRISLKKDAYRDYESNLGYVRILTNCKKDELISAYDARLLCVESWNHLYGIIESYHKYTGENIDSEPQKFIESLVLMIYLEMSDTLASNGFVWNVREALEIASSLKLISSPLGEKYSKCTRDAEKILKLFDCYPQENDTPRFTASGSRKQRNPRRL